MSICDLNTSVGRIQRATKELKDAWQIASKDWNDQTAKDFEERFLNPILPNIRMVLAEVNELSNSLQKAERDCCDEAKLEL